MDLASLNSGIPATKTWLNPVVNVLTAATINSGPSLGPAVVSQYSQTSSIIVSNTVLGSISDTATFVGSLTVPPVPVGTIIKLKALGLSSVAAATVNFALYVDGKQATVPSGTTGTPTFTNAATEVESYISIKAAAVSAYCGANISGVQPLSNLQLAATYDHTQPHILDIFASFSAAAVGNSFTCASFFVELSNSP